MTPEKKVCRTCEAEKSVDDFWKNARLPGGRYHDCKGCAYAKEKANLQKRLTENPHYNYERQKAWRERTGRSGMRNNAAKHLKQKYGISIEEYDRMLREQNGLCGVCEKGFTGDKKPVVDHDHDSGKVRALVHYGCNTAIGLLLDSPELCRKAAEYLEHHRRV